MSREELEAWGLTLQLCVMTGAMTEQEALKTLQEVMSDSTRDTPVD